MVVIGQQSHRWQSEQPGSQFTGHQRLRRRQETCLLSRSTHTMHLLGCIRAVRGLVAFIGSCDLSRRMETPRTERSSGAQCVYLFIRPTAPPAANRTRTSSITIYPSDSRVCPPPRHPGALIPPPVDAIHLRCLVTSTRYLCGCVAKS